MLKKRGLEGVLSRLDEERVPDKVTGGAGEEV